MRLACLQTSTKHDTVSGDILFDMQRSSSGSDILDDSCWRKEIPNIGLVSVAGKIFGPNPKALNAAMTALGQLESNLRQIMSHDYGEDVRSEWLLEEIWVPYQLIDIYYLRFSSEYGAEMDIAFKLSDCEFGHAGMYSVGDSDDDSIVSVPGRVKYVVDELQKSDVPPRNLAGLNDKILNEEIMGPELLESVFSFVQQNREFLPANMAAHYTRMIQPAMHLAEKFRC